MGNSNYVVSIDLGSNKIVAALGTLSPEGKTIVKDIVCKPLEGGFLRGEVTNVEQVSNVLNSAIEELEQRVGIKIDEAVVGVSGRQVVFAPNSNFVYVDSDDRRIGINDEKKLQGIMSRLQAPEGRVILSRLPLYYKIDANEIKGSPVGSFGRHVEATYGYVMASSASLERVDNVLDRVGISERTYLPAALASGEATTLAEERSMGVATIDIGATTTDLVVYYDNKVRYAASIPLGADAINNDIRTTAVPRHAIEKLKTKYGYATASAVPYEMLNSVFRIPGRSAHEKNKEISYRDLTAIIECRMVDIINFVIEELKESGFHTQIDTLVLTGGGSQLKGIDTLFKERTGINTRIGGAEMIDRESVEGATSLVYATAVGLLSLGFAESNIQKGVLTESQDEEEDNDNNDDGGFFDDSDTSDQPIKVKRPTKTKPPKEEKQDNKGPRFIDRLKGLIGKFDTAVFGRDIVDDEDL